MAVYQTPRQARNISRIKVCVDSIENAEPSGRLINTYRKDEARFNGIMDMINQTDGFLTQMNFPRAYNKYRSFDEQMAAEAKRQNNTEVTSYMGEDVFETKLGEKLTFVIQVQFRQNSTWQGTITWTEQKKTQHFRSTLEMIKLMDSALEAQAAGEFVSWQ